MFDLSQADCSACHADSAPLTDSELADLRPQIADWQIDATDGVAKLRRDYRFDNFMQAMTFANLVAELAETYNHHPLLAVEWGRVGVCWWTHKIHGLHLNDAVLAAKTDVLFLQSRTGVG